MADESKSVLKGNFQPKREVTADTHEDLTTKFEREAIKRLGGSICFVSKKKFIYGVNNEKTGETGATKESQ